MSPHVWIPSRLSGVSDEGPQAHPLAETDGCSATLYKKCIIYLTYLAALFKSFRIIDLKIDAYSRDILHE